MTKEKKSNLGKMYFGKKTKLLQQQNDRTLHFNDLVRFYVEMDNRLKSLEGEADNKILVDR